MHSLKTETSNSINALTQKLLLPDRSTELIYTSEETAETS